MKLKTSLQSYDADDVLASIGALQLIPENADFLFRLEVLAELAAESAVSNPTAQPFIAEASQICNGNTLSAYFSFEDPCDNLFTEEVTLAEGGFLVFLGLSEEVTFHLRHLAVALSQLRTLTASDYVTIGYQTLLAALAISNEIAKRAGLTRDISPNHEGTEVVVPDASTLEHFKTATTFDRASLESLLHPFGIPFEVIEPLIHVAGNPVAQGALFLRPLVLVNDTYIVPIPSALPVAARHRVITDAVASGGTVQFREAFDAAVWDNVLLSLERTGLKPWPLPNWPGTNPFVREAYFPFDVDKLLCVLLLTDPLAEWQAHVPFGSWATRAGEDEVIRERLGRIRKALRQIQPHAPDKVLFMVIRQGVGRTHVHHLPRPNPGSTTLMTAMTAADLEVVTYLEDRDPLALWKIARAISDAPPASASSFLDQYAVYRSNGRSFHVSDDVRPMFVTFAPGGAGVLRAEVRQRHVFHAAQLEAEGRWTEVRAFHGPRVSVFAPVTLGRPPQVLILVESLPVPLWVHGIEPPVDAAHDLRHRTFQHADLVAYWLWELGRDLAAEVLSLQRFSVLHVTVELESADDWFLETPVAVATVATAVAHSFEVRSDPTTGRITSRFRASIFAALNRADNAGEREVARSLLVALRGLLSEDERTCLSDDAINALLVRRAPLGAKKKLVASSSTAQPELDHIGIPPVRRVSNADENTLLDEVGRHLHDSESVEIGTVSTVQTVQILNQAVAYLYQQLQTDMAALLPSEALEFFVSQYEALIQADAADQLTIPTRLACFPDDPATLEIIEQSLAVGVKSRVAARFLVEYATAVPPAGNLTLSLERLDRLMANAALIVRFGQQSDLVRAKLAEITVSMTPSFRLDVKGPTFERARDAFRQAQTDSEIQRLQTSFGDLWDRGEHEHSDLAESLDAASVAEFGLPMSDLIAFLNAVVTVGHHVTRGVARLPASDLIDQTAAILGWDRTRSEAVLSTLASLGSRANYLQPPQPWKPHAVYPWRLNRALSYLRRPLLRLQTERGQTDVVWGPRHLSTVMSYLLELCISGRLEATSPEMKAFLGERNGVRGESFNLRVADLMSEVSGLAVRAKVGAFGQIRIRDAQKLDLGDIDVLAIDQERRKIWAVECKDLAVARTSWELGGESQNIFLGDATKRPPKKSLLEKHARRVQWMRDNLATVLQSYGIGDSPEIWSVQPLFVVSEPLLSPYLYQAPTPILAIRDLVAYLVSDDIAP